MWGLRKQVEANFNAVYNLTSLQELKTYPNSHVEKKTNAKMNT